MHTTKFVTLSQTEHKHLKIQPSKVEALGAQQTMVPVVINEFKKLCVQYPIVLTKNGDTGQFICVALLGFEKGENLLWQDEQWQGIYTPINISRQPFFIGQESADAQPLLCIDTNSPCLSENTGEPLFNEQGEATAFLNNIKTLLSQLIAGQTHTQNFIDALIKHSLISPLTLDITLVNKQNQKVNGLYSIDEAKLDALSNEALVELKQSGHLHAIYTMMDTLGHIYGLIQRKNERLKKLSD